MAKTRIPARPTARERMDRVHAHQERVAKVRRARLEKTVADLRRDIDQVEHDVELLHDAG